MNRKKIVSTSLAIAVVIMACSVCTLAGWEEVYQTNFSANPGWITNNNSLFHWDSADQTYYIDQVNVNHGGYWSYFDVGYDGGSFKLDYDIKMTYGGYASGLNFGMYDSDMQTQLNGSYVETVFGSDDRGHSVLMDTANASNVYSNNWSADLQWSPDTWYNVSMVYSESTNTFTSTVKNRSTGDLVGTKSATAGLFTSDMSRLGSSNVREGTFQVSDAHSTAEIDNVVFSQLWEGDRPARKVYLNFDASTLPAEIKRKFDRQGNKEYKIVRGNGAEMPTVYQASNLQEYRSKLQADVEYLFAKSGVTNIEFVEAPDIETTVAYFLQSDGTWSDGIAARGPLDDARFVVDQFNASRNDTVFIFPVTTPVAGGGYELPNEGDDAETTAHELGHTFGLRHINPKDADGREIPCIMDYDYDGITSEVFPNVVSEIVRLPSGKPLGGSHNPAYHLGAYLEGLAPDDLIAHGISPGSWDLHWYEKMDAILDFAAGDMPLYDVSLFGGYGAGMDDDVSALLVHFDETTLSELSGLTFSMEPGMILKMYASSTPEIAEWDIWLATGNPFDPTQRLIEPTEGIQSVFLQQWLPGSPLGYATLAEGTLTGQIPSAAIPAPGAILLRAPRRWPRRLAAQTQSDLTECREYCLEGHETQRAEHKRGRAHRQ